LWLGQRIEGSYGYVHTSAGCIKIEEVSMRKLGNTLTGIGFIGVCLITGVEPDPAVTGSFFIHAGIIMIFALTMVTGIAAARVK
jgi:hypothetical protein